MEGIRSLRAASRQARLQACDPDAPRRSARLERLEQPDALAFAPTPLPEKAMRRKAAKAAIEAPAEEANVVAASPTRIRRRLRGKRSDDSAQDPPAPSGRVPTQGNLKALEARGAASKVASILGLRCPSKPVRSSSASADPTCPKCWEPFLVTDEKWKRCPCTHHRCGAAEQTLNTFIEQESEEVILILILTMHMF